MTKPLVRIVFSGLVLMLAWPAQAQDRKWGLLFAYPGSVGLQWDVAEKFALRVDGDFNRNHTELESVQGDPPIRLTPTIVPIFISTLTETTTISGSIAVSGLFTLHARDQLEIYVAPRVGVAIANLTSRTEWDVSGVPPALLAALTLPANDEQSRTNYSPDISAKVGASYRPGDRFAVFGETGAGYTRSSSSTLPSNLEVTHSTFGLRAGIGGILYF
jgi:hypothetical protein